MKNLSYLLLPLVFSCGVVPIYTITEEEAQNLATRMKAIDRCLYPDGVVHNNLSKIENTEYFNKKNDEIALIIGNTKLRNIRKHTPSLNEFNAKIGNFYSTADVGNASTIEQAGGCENYRNNYFATVQQKEEEKRQAELKAEEEKRQRELQAQREKEARDAYYATPEGQAALAQERLQQQQLELQRQQLAQQRQLQQQQLEIQRQQLKQQQQYIEQQKQQLELYKQQNKKKRWL